MFEHGIRKATTRGTPRLLCDAACTRQRVWRECDPPGLRRSLKCFQTSQPCARHQLSADAAPPSHAFRLSPTVTSASLAFSSDDPVQAIDDVREDQGSEVLENTSANQGDAFWCHRTPETAIHLFRREAERFDELYIMSTSTLQIGQKHRPSACIRPPTTCLLLCPT